MKGAKMKLRKLSIILVAVFLLLSCPMVVFATHSEDSESTIGGQDASGNYRWRVPLGSQDLIPGASGSDLGSTTDPIAEIHATTVYVANGFSSQGSNASTEYAAGNTTIDLDYGIHALTTGAGEVVTVPDGSYAGQTIVIGVETDGGHAFVRPTTSTFFTTMNMDAVLDSVTLTWVSSTYGWMCTGQVGATPE